MQDITSKVQKMECSKCHQHLTFLGAFGNLQKYTNMEHVGKRMHLGNCAAFNLAQGYIQYMNDQQTTSQKIGLDHM